jgi:hypothetical protein
MMSMNRRDWLTGVVTSVIGAQMVIAAKTAEPLGSLVIPNQEIKIFSPGEAAGLALSSLLGTVYAKDGKEYYPVGRVHRVEHYTGQDQMNRWKYPQHEIDGLPEKRYARGEIEFYPEIFDRIRLR